jgi:hypothetical protein
MSGPTPCSGCGALIRWTRTPAGHLIPLDAEPNDKGNIRLDGENVAHVIPKADLFAPEQQTEGDRWMPHHATCPEAHRFRKRKRQ